MRRIDASNGPPPLGHADREALALFLALQMTRTTEHRERALFVERLVRWAGDRVITKDVVAQYLEQVHLGFAAKDPEIEAAHLVATVTMSEPSVMTQQWAVEMMLTSARELVPRILRLNWTIEIDRHHTFITSDMPIVLWRKPTRRDNYEGLGIANSEELRFSLDPQKVLVLSRRKRQATINVQPHRVSRLNADLASACHRFILGNPDDRATVDAPFMYRIRPVLRFWTGPLFVTGEDGQSRRAEGDVIQQWVPRNDRVGRPQTRTRLT